jgi:hypothetical protein
MGEAAEGWLALDRYGFKLIGALCAGVILIAMALFGRVGHAGLKQWAPASMAAALLLVPVVVVFAMLFWGALRLQGK